MIIIRNRLTWSIDFNQERENLLQSLSIDDHHPKSVDLEHRFQSRTRKSFTIAVHSMIIIRNRLTWSIDFNQERENLLQSLSIDDHHPKSVDLEHRFQSRTRKSFTIAVHR